MRHGAGAHWGKTAHSPPTLVFSSTCSGFDIHACARVFTARSFRENQPLCSSEPQQVHDGYAPWFSSTSTMENGQVATYADFPILKGALLDSIKKSATRFLRGKAPWMKNLILSTLPHAKAWSIVHVCMRCFVLWVGVSCLRKSECPRVKRVESLRHSKTLQIERFFDTLSTWTPP